MDTRAAPPSGDAADFQHLLHRLRHCPLRHQKHCLVRHGAAGHPPDAGSAACAHRRRQYVLQRRKRRRHEYVGGLLLLCGKPLLLAGMPGAGIPDAHSDESAGDAEAGGCRLERRLVSAASVSHSAHLLDAAAEPDLRLRIAVLSKPGVAGSAVPVSPADALSGRSDPGRKNAGVYLRMQRLCSGAVLSGFQHRHIPYIICRAAILLHVRSDTAAADRLPVRVRQRMRPADHGCDLAPLPATGHGLRQSGHHHGEAPGDFGVQKHRGQDRPSAWCLCFSCSASTGHPSRPTPSGCICSC